MKMILRKLELKDAPFMLGWMHDRDATQHLRADFSSKTIKDAEDFIQASWDDRKNINLAIASDEDEYMGTVSLKDIDDGSAEFAIVVRPEAMGRGYSWFGMKGILEKAFGELELESVCWCVSRDNTRAVRFYDKHHFQETDDIPERFLSSYEGTGNLKWYAAIRKKNCKQKS